MRDKKRKLAVRWSFLLWSRFEQERIRAIPQGVSEVSNGYAAAVPGFKSSGGVLKVSGGSGWLINPGSWYETDEELSPNAEMSCVYLNARRVGSVGSSHKDSQHLHRHRS